MQWYILLIVLGAVSDSALSADNLIPRTSVNDSSIDCIKHFSGYQDYKLNIHKILGLWYQVKNDSEPVNCLEFQILSEQERNAVAKEIKFYVNGTDFSRFSLVVKRNCPEKKFNDTEFHFFAKLDDKGVFDALFVPINRNRIDAFRATVFVNTFEVGNKVYMGIAACNVLMVEDDPIIFERQLKRKNTVQEIRNLETAFNKKFIIV